MSARPSPSVMSDEVARFDALGDTWWDPDGPMAPLHRLNPVRIGWARDLIARHFKLETQVGAPLAGVDLLDVGCGAGLFAEPLARLGANVVGVDLPFHMRGDVADPLNVGDRRAAEFHHQTRHGSLKPWGRGAGSRNA